MLAWSITIGVLGFEIPLIAIALSITAVLGLIIRFKTHLTKAPDYFFIYTLASMVMSFHWIWACSSLVVKYSEVVGFALQTPAIYLGITFLAIGNSINDIVANIAVLQRGFPVMSLTSSLASPLFNLLVGLGSSFLALLVKSGKESIKLAMHEYSCVLPMLCSVTVTILLIELILIAVYNGFVLGKTVAKIMMIGYGVFLVIATGLTFIDID